MVMYLLVLVYIFLASSVGATRRQQSICGRLTVHESLIIRGAKVLRGGAPWQVRLRAVPKNHTHLCGGVIIGKRHILTAAHCIKFHDSELGDTELTARDLQVHVGDHEGFFEPSKDPEYVNNSTYPVQITPVDPHEKIVEVGRIIVHESFVDGIKSLDNDIALLELRLPLVYNHWVKPVCLPRGDPAPGKLCYTTGWGNRKPGNVSSYVRVLHQVALPVMDTERCNRTYSGTVIEVIPSLHLCAGYHNTSVGPCNADSGGPLVCQNEDAIHYLQGIVSFRTIHCQPGPSVFTRVTTYVDWINQHISGWGPQQQCGRREKPSYPSRRTAARGQYPWQVRIRHTLEPHVCGGAIIAPRWILTSAQCTRETAYQVHVGDNRDGMDPHEISVVIIRRIEHENFRVGESSVDNDIALLELRDPLDYNSMVKPVCLSDDPPIRWEKCWTSGWGFNVARQTRTPTLRSLSVDIEDQWFCQYMSRLHSRTPLTSKALTFNASMHLCAGIKFTLACKERGWMPDIGSPLVCERGNGSWVLQGLASYGQQSCGIESQARGFTKVSHYLPWIRRHTGIVV